jgi:dienelactone hydrolase
MHAAMAMTPAPETAVAGEPQGRGGSQPAIDVPWNDAIPPGTADHAARALRESSRHGEWVDVYAGNDARIGATVPPTQAAMQKLGKSYEVHTYEGAGHGFMFSQAGAGGANLEAAEQSWPLVVQFFRNHLS